MPQTNHEPQEQTSFRLPKTLLARLREFCVRRGIGRSEWLRGLVEDGLKKEGA